MAYRIEDGANEFPLRTEVYQSNPLINARKTFDLMGMRIFILGLRGLNPHFSKKDRFFDEDFKETFIPASELTKLFQNTKYLSEMKEACRKLFNTTIEIKNGAGEITLTHIFKKLEYNSSKGLRLKFDEEMRPYILNLAESGGYTMIKADYLFKLSSPYAVRILELLLQYQNIKMFREIKEVRRKFTFEELRYLLNVPENAYKNRPDNFKKYVLDVPIKEITERTPYKVHYRVIKTGRRVYAFEFVLDTFHAPVEILNGQRTYFGETAINQLCKMGFSDKVAQAIFLKCNGAKDCLSRINRAEAILHRQRKPITNKLGFLRRAIEEDWQILGPNPHKKTTPPPRIVPSRANGQLLNMSDILDVTQSEIPEAPLQKNRSSEIMQQRFDNDSPTSNETEKPSLETRAYSTYDEEQQGLYTGNQSSESEASETKERGFADIDTESDNEASLSSDNSASSENNPTPDSMSQEESAQVGQTYKAVLSAHETIRKELNTMDYAMNSAIKILLEKEFQAEERNEPPPPLTEEEKKEMRMAAEIIESLPPVIAGFFLDNKKFKLTLQKERESIVQAFKVMTTRYGAALSFLKEEFTSDEIIKGSLRLKDIVKTLEKSITMDNDRELREIITPPDNESNDSASDTGGLTTLGNIFGSMNLSKASDSTNTPSNESDNSASDTGGLTTLGNIFGSMNLSKASDSTNTPSNESDNSASDTGGLTSPDEYILNKAREASLNINWTIRKPPKQVKTDLPDTHLLLAILHYRLHPKEDLTVEDIASLAREISSLFDIIDANFSDIKRICIMHKPRADAKDEEADRKRCTFMEGKLKGNPTAEDIYKERYNKDIAYLDVIDGIRRMERGDNFGFDYLEGLTLKKLYRYFDMTYTDYLKIIIKRLITNRKTSYELR